jgi:hypothetical protein
MFVLFIFMNDIDAVIHHLFMIYVVPDNLNAKSEAVIGSGEGLFINLCSSRIDRRPVCNSALGLKRGPVATRSLARLFRKRWSDPWSRPCIRCAAPLFTPEDLAPDPFVGMAPTSVHPSRLNPGRLASGRLNAAPRLFAGAIEKPTWSMIAHASLGMS